MIWVRFPLTCKMRRVASGALIPFSQTIFLIRWNWWNWTARRKGFSWRETQHREAHPSRDVPSHPREDSEEEGGKPPGKGGPGTARSHQDFHSQVAGWGPGKHPLGRTQRQQKGVRAHQEPMKAVFDSGASPGVWLRWHYSFSAVPHFTGKAQQAYNARVFKHSEGCDAINKLLCQRLNQPRCLPCQLYFWNNVFSTEIKIHVNPFLLTG